MAYAPVDTVTGTSTHDSEDERGRVGIFYAELAVL
tara:strand:+ start:363 stop:467 length:105 start_codon:yes stop_codon:yes gene_type:complete